MTKNKSLNQNPLLYTGLKLFLFMKLSCLLILTTALQISAKTFSQENLTIKLNNVELSKALKEVEKKSNYRFVFSNMIIPQKAKVNIDVKEMPLSNVLDKLLLNTGLTFQLLENNLVVINHGTTQPRILTVSGKVTNIQGDPLPNVSITVNNSSKGTTTNERGEFSLEVDEAATLNFSYVGFENQSVKVEGRSDLGTIILAETSSNLTDVVVVGYGTSRRKDVTGAVSSISSKEFTTGLVTNPMDQIQGKVSGLVVTRPDGDPNGNVVIRLRGQTSLTGGQSPLIVVDGVQLDDVNQIVNIPPGDILSYDVLKDASATSIYGSRGANGVIIINTKKGRSGKAQVDYSGFTTLSTVARTYELLSTKEFLTAAAQIPGVDTAALNAGNPNENNDWQAALYRKAISHSHTVGISGGTGGFNYRGSVNYLHQPGIVINNGRQQIGLRFNAEQKALKDKLVIQVGVVNTQNNRDLVDRNVFLNAYAIPPYFPITLADGTDNPVFSYNYQNPLLLQKLKTNRSEQNFSQLYGTVNYSLFDGLIVGATGSIMKDNNQGEYYLPVIPGWNNANAGSKSTSNANSSKGDMHINYLKDFGKHNISATGVYEYNHFTNSYYTASSGEFVVDATGADALGSGNTSRNVVNSFKSEFKIISFLARVAYNFDSKYYITASIRRDGSSKFGVNHQWGNFPSISAAWRIKNERFMENVNWVDELKINAGFGITGNQDAIGPYTRYTLLGQQGNTYNPTSSDNPFPVGFGPIQNPNPDLRWEERRGRNIGLDFSVFKNLLSGNISYFNDETHNLLYYYTVPVPPNFVNNVLANVGNLRNKGVEIQLNANIISTRDFSWSAGGQITTINTKVTNLSGTWDGNQVGRDNIPAGHASGRGLSSNPITYLVIGKSPFSFLLPHYLGYDDDGMPLFEAESGTTKDPMAAKQHYIDPYPKFNYGFNTTVTYKNWSLNAFLRGVQGQKIFNNTRLNLANYNSLPSVNVIKEAITSGLRDNPTPSDYWLENASYARLENLTLSYNFTKIKGIDNLRFYAAANNLFVITPYKGLDPEIATTDASGGGSGNAFIDLTYNAANAFYPKSRSFTIGVNIAFK